MAKSFSPWEYVVKLICFYSLIDKSLTIPTAMIYEVYKIDYLTWIADVLYYAKVLSNPAASAKECLSVADILIGRFCIKIITVRRWIGNPS